MANHFHDDPAWQEAYEIRTRNYEEAGFSPAAQAAAMRAELFFDKREAAFEKDFRGREKMSAEYAARLADIGMIDDDGNMKSYYFEHLEAAGALDTDRADFYARYKEAPTATPGPQPRNDLEADDEESRRAGRGGGGNPANASHSLNIRPDVVEGPAGLEVRTSMKSANYRADPDLKADLAEAERSAREEDKQQRSPSAESERGAAQQTLTHEAIKRDPWNAVELPLPANARADLLHAARSAAEYCAVGEHELMLAAHEGRYTPPGWTGADGEPDVHEYNEEKWLQADKRLGLINEQIDRLEGRGVHAQAARAPDAPPLTNEQRDIYMLTLRNYPPDAQVYPILEYQLDHYQDNHAFPRVVDALRSLLPDSNGVPYPWPLTFGEVLEHIERGITAPEAFRERLARGFEADVTERNNAIAQRANAESAKRQDAERAARSGEDLPADPASSATPSLAADLRAAEKAAKIEREAEGQELVTHDLGEGKTPGGGGRGIF